MYINLYFFFGNFILKKNLFFLKINLGREWQVKFTLYRPPGQAQMKPTIS